jgi:hypothetical protein
MDEHLLVRVLVIVGLCLSLPVLWRLRLEWRRLDELNRRAREERGDDGRIRTVLGRVDCWGIGPYRRMSLRGRNLRGADLSGAFLQATDLSDADLREADLRGADLRQAFLAGADLTGARYDDRTRWPDGFAPRRHGAVRVPPAAWNAVEGRRREEAEQTDS